MPLSLGIAATGEVVLGDYARPQIPVERRSWAVRRLADGRALSTLETWRARPPTGPSTRPRLGYRNPPLSDLTRGPGAAGPPTWIKNWLTLG